MHDLSDWDRLDAAGFYVSVLRSVRRVAWFSVGIGLFVASCGLAALPSPALIIVGLLLAATGAWNLWRPSPTGMLVDGLAMIGVGLFNCLIWLLVPGQGDHAGPRALGRPPPQPGVVPRGPAGRWAPAHALPAARPHSTTPGGSRSRADGRA